MFIDSYYIWLVIYYTLYIVLAQGAVCSLEVQEVEKF